MTIDFYYIAMNSFFDGNVREFQWTATPGLTAHLMALTYFVHRVSMENLAADEKYRNLNINYEGYISLLAERDYAPGELAAKLGISKQACSKTIREIEKLELLSRRPNPQDSRSSLLSLSEKGLQLLSDGIKATHELQQQFAGELGAGRLEELFEVMDKLCRALSIDIPTYRTLEIAGNNPVGKFPRLTLLLPMLSDYCYKALIASLSEKGFRGLKPNFSQVIGLIGPEGGRIQQISALVGISKQAVAVIASELEQLGYISREPDLTDKRQIILQLSPQGQRLLKESADSIQALENTLKQELSEEEYRLLEETMAALFDRMKDHDGHHNISLTKIQQLSETLLDDLGVAGAQMLAQQLITITRGKL